MGKKKDKKRDMGVEEKLAAANRMALSAFEMADGLQRAALDRDENVEEATAALERSLEALEAVQAATTSPLDEELVHHAFKRSKAALSKAVELENATQVASKPEPEPAEDVSSSVILSAGGEAAEVEGYRAAPARCVPTQPAPAPVLENVSRETFVRDAPPEPAPEPSGRAAVALRIARASVEAAEAAQKTGLPQAATVLEASHAALALAEAAARAEAASTPDTDALMEVALASASRALADAQSLSVPAPEPIADPVAEPGPEPERTTIDLPFIENVAIPSSSAPVPVPAPEPSTLTSSGTPPASPDGSMPAPGSLPLSPKEQKLQARAEARAVKERAAAHKTADAQAKADAKAEAARAKEAAKQERHQAKADAKASKRTGAAATPAPEAAPAPASAQSTPVSENVSRETFVPVETPTPTPAPVTAPVAPAPEQPKQSHAARNVCIALLLLLLVVAGLVLAAWLGLFRLPDAVQSRIDLLPDLHATSGKLNAADSPVAPGSYRLVVNQIPTSQGPENVVNVEFENPTQNTYSARMDVYLDDTGELVGSTRMIAPGSYLEDLALAGDLPSGTYQATAKVGVYSGATQVNTMSAALELRIEG